MCIFLHIRPVHQQAQPSQFTVPNLWFHSTHSKKLVKLDHETPSFGVKTPKCLRLHLETNHFLRWSLVASCSWYLRWWHLRLGARISMKDLFLGSFQGFFNVSLMDIYRMVVDLFIDFQPHLPCFMFVLAPPSGSFTPPSSRLHSQAESQPETFFEKRMAFKKRNSFHSVCSCWHSKSWIISTSGCVTSPSATFYQIASPPSTKLTWNLKNHNKKNRSNLFVALRGVQNLLHTGYSFSTPHYTMMCRKNQPEFMAPRMTQSLVDSVDLRQRKRKTIVEESSQEQEQLQL